MSPDSAEVRRVLDSITRDWREKHAYTDIYAVLFETGFSDEVQHELAVYLSDVNSFHRRAILAAILDLECMPSAELDLAVEEHCLPFSDLAFLSRWFLGID